MVRLMVDSIPEGLDFREEANHFDVNPDQGNENSESSIPFHVLGGTVFRPGFNKSKIGNEGEGCYDQDEECHANTDGP